MLEKVLRIVELRQAGKTWYECDGVMFPEATEVQKRRQSPSAKLCKAAGELGNLAFQKRVIGCYTPTQFVVKNPNFRRVATPVVLPAPQTMEMFI